MSHHVENNKQVAYTLHTHAYFLIVAPWNSVKITQKYGWLSQCWRNAKYLWLAGNHSRPRKFELTQIQQQLEGSNLFYHSLLLKTLPGICPVYLVVIPAFVGYNSYTGPYSLSSWFISTWQKNPTRYWICIPDFDSRFYYPIGYRSVESKVYAPLFRPINMKSIWYFILKLA